MSKYIAVDGCELACKNIAASATITVPAPPTTKVSADGKKIWAQQIDFILTGYSLPPFSQTAPITGSIIATAMFTSSGKTPVVLEEDMSLPLTIVGTAGSSAATVTDVVYVKSAGQDVVMAK